MENKLSGKAGVILAGGVVGLIAVILVVLGNPLNMGFCIACFLRDSAGAVGLHQADPVQYMRPEIIGLVLGAFAISFVGKEFRPKGGSAIFTRFILGFFVMIGALMFLGCPLRMILRMAGGDLNAIVGLAGFAVGIAAGVFFLNKGFSLGRAYTLNRREGYAFPLVQGVFLVMLIVFPALLIFSKEGPGSMHAPIWASLIGGLAVGALAQKTRLCTVAGIRDGILFRDFTMLLGFAAILVVALVGNVATGYFNLGFEAQPIAHTDGLWNFLGMALVGLGSVLLGGCPLRQLVLSGEGNLDSVITVIGLTAGAAFAHNFKLASSAEGPTLAGQVAIIIGFLVMLVIIVCYRNSGKEA